MCGICFVLSQREDTDNPLDFNQLVSQSEIGNRGPDFSRCHLTNISQSRLLFGGFVLHLRGQATPQPVCDETGNVLLWNGEIFGGLQISEDDNDTQMLFNSLAQCEKPEEVLDLMTQVQGPWAFIFWQAPARRLWFGRDVFGRRSLLWHLPTDDDDHLVLSSVQIRPLVFSEIPSVGLFCLQFLPPKHDCSSSSISPTVTLYPWRDAVWPGTLDRVDSQQSDIFKHLYSVSVNLQFTVDKNCTLGTGLPQINRELPSPSYKLPPLDASSDLLSDPAYHYLKKLMNDSEMFNKVVQQLLSVLESAVRKRVYNLPRPSWTFGEKNEGGKLGSEKGPFYKHSEDKYGIPVTIATKTGETIPCSDQIVLSESCDKKIDSTMQALQLSDVCTPLGKKDSLEGSGGENGSQAYKANVAILFSGGVDSAVLAALADRCIPQSETIDLLNVAFEQQARPQANSTKSEKREPVMHLTDKDKHETNFNVPDRQTGYLALGELNPNRNWNLIEVNVTQRELQKFRSQHVRHLLYPLGSVLDDSIGCAIWFAARGQGILGNGPHKGHQFVSQAKVILCGMGADEQLVGYSRHRVRFKDKGWGGIVDEIQMEINRISARNLGRDDRIIADHGKESRFPFLDEEVVNFLAGLPVYIKADLNLPRGIGEKLLLRLAALELALPSTAVLPKRAIQFGSKIAKMENSKEKATDICTRLLGTPK